MGMRTQVRWLNDAQGAGTQCPGTDKCGAYLQVARCLNF